MRSRLRLPLEDRTTVEPRSQPAGLCVGGKRHGVALRAVGVRHHPSPDATRRARILIHQGRAVGRETGRQASRGRDRRHFPTGHRDAPDRAGRLPQIGIERQTAPFRNARDRWIDAEVERLPVWRPANVREARRNRRRDHAIRAAGSGRDDNALPHAGRIVAHERDELAVGRNRRQACLLGGQFAFRAVGRTGGGIERQHPHELIAATVAALRVCQRIAGGRHVEVPQWAGSEAGARLARPIEQPGLT